MIGKSRDRLVVVLLLVFLVSCAPKVRIAPYVETKAKITVEIQRERDEIYMLTAYSVVLKDWQRGGAGKRGHNIGSILVAPNGAIVNWARNCNAALSNGTQHGEVRLIMGYLNRVGGYSLKNYTIYTTLEPCAQCSGMMVLSRIKRTVYGQSDPGFGKAVERLALDSKKWNDTGYKPYPHRVISNRSETSECEALQKAYEDYRPRGGIAKFLTTGKAKSIYENAAKKLSTYKLMFPKENGEILKNAMKTVDLARPGIPVICIKKK